MEEEQNEPPAVPKPLPADYRSRMITILDLLWMLKPGESAIGETSDPEITRPLQTMLAGMERLIHELIHLTIPIKCDPKLGVSFLVLPARNRLIYRFTKKPPGAVAALLEQERYQWSGKLKQWEKTVATRDDLQGILDSLRYADRKMDSVHSEVVRLMQKDAGK